MFMEIVYALLLPPLLILLFIYVIHVYKLKKYPSGPFPLPLIGNLHQVGAVPYKGIRDLSRKYGSVCSVSFGSERVVSVNTIECAREALIKSGDDFAGRPESLTYDLLSRGYKTIALAEYGPFYNTIKKIGHSALKLFGEGTVRIEKLAVEESDYLHQRLRDADGQSVDVHQTFGLSVLNIICDLTFGKRYREDEKEFKDFVNSTDLIFSGLGASDVVAVFPWLGFLPLKGITNLRKGIAIRDVLYRKKVVEHQETFDADNIRDITDCILKVLQDENIADKAGVDFFTDDHVDMMINDIFVGGTETTLTTLRWAMAYFIRWPENQEKIYQEIQTVCGANRYPTYTDRFEMHFTYAAILEIMRLSSIGPFGFPRKTTKDTVLDGQPIPKGTQVLFNLWAIHHDERHWDKPEEFNPQRFLDDEGKYVTGANKSFLPFGMGKRQCFGEAMAKMELFVIISRLIKDFVIEKVPGQPLPKLQGILGVTLTPEHFNAIFKPRNNNICT